jgi:hypothetical protein
MTWHTESSFTPDAIDRQMNASETFSWLTGSEMGGRIRAFDWRRTPLGPIEIGLPHSCPPSVSV